MTAVEEKAFGEVVDTLAAATRAKVDEATFRAFWEGLQDLPFSAVEASAKELGASGSWFPKLAEWRSAAQLAHEHAIRAALPVRERVWRHYCDACEDVGMVFHVCEPGRRCGAPAAESICGRDGADAANHTHTYVSRCACFESNPELIRQRLQQRERAKQRDDAGRQKRSGS